MFAIRIPLFIIPEKISRRIAQPFLGVGRVLVAPFKIGKQLRMLESDMDEGEYFAISAINAGAWSAIVFALVRVLSRYASPESVMTPTIATFFLLMGLFMVYPAILIRKLVESVDKDLIYALKDIHIQISSGIPLYEALKNVSLADHGNVSRELREVVQDINAGEAQDTALEKLALRSESEFVKKAIWQIVIALRTGASLQGTVKNLVDNMRQFQSAKVKSYTQEMNLWILLYLIVAVAIPSLGATLITILSSFSATQVREPVFLALLLACFLAEYIIIKYVKISRPLVYT